MNDRYLYIAIDICCVIVPFVAAFHSKFPFNSEWRSIIPAMGITAVVFILWDMIFTQLGVWRFNDKYIMGLHFGNLPVEEVGFFLCIPYACLFLYYCVDRYIKNKVGKPVIVFFPILAVIVIILAVIYLDRIYTSATMLLLGTLLIMLTTRFRSIAGTFLISFVVSLLPFFISNGMLTGSWVDEPVVIYNNQYNLGIRIATIPVEDVFYGMAFQLINVMLFQYFRSGANAGGQKLSRVLRVY